MLKSDIKPMGTVIFFGEKEPVIWERETQNYVFNIKRLIWENGKWTVRKKYFEDKMDKEEIFDF